MRRLPAALCAVIAACSSCCTAAPAPMYGSGVSSGRQQLPQQRNPEAWDGDNSVPFLSSDYPVSRPAPYRPPTAAATAFTTATDASTEPEPITAQNIRQVRMQTDAAGRIVTAQGYAAMEQYDYATRAAREIAITRTNPVLNFGRGMVDGTVKTVQGVAEAIVNPVDTTKMIVEAASNPFETAQALVQEIKENTETEGLSHTLGIVGADVSMAVIPGTAISKGISKISQSTKAVDKVADASRAAKMADNAADASRAAGAADKAGDAGRAGGASGAATAETIGSATAGTTRGVDAVGNTVELAHQTAESAQQAAEVAGARQKYLELFAKHKFMQNKKMRLKRLQSLESAAAARSARRARLYTPQERDYNAMRF